MSAMPDTITSRRPLGRSDMQISPLGIGAWAMGGADWASGLGHQDDRDSIHAICRSVERGVKWIDTAAVYGLGHSEEVVGQAVRKIPQDDRPYVFTKGGLIWDEDDHLAEPQRNIAPDSIRRECEDSLRRLKLDSIDLYQLHWPDDFGTPVEDSWETMLELKNQAKVRALGVSNFDVELLERCEALGHVDSAQPPFSLINRAAAADVIPWCQANGTAVIQPDAVGSAQRPLHARARAEPAERRLPRPDPVVPRARAQPQPSPPGRAEADRRASRRACRGDRRGRGGRLAGRHRRDSGRALCGAGGRLERRWNARAHQRRHL